MSTPTLTLSQLNSELLRIYAHGLSATNVLAVQHTAAGVIFETDTSELEARIAEVEADRFADGVEYRGQIKELGDEIARLKAALHSVADRAKEAKP